MDAFEVIRSWFESYGGLVPFLIAMSVFGGSYSLLAGLLKHSSEGTRRAIAICCLCIGLLVGKMVPDIPVPVILHTETSPRIVPSANAVLFDPNIFFKMIACCLIPLGLYVVVARFIGYSSLFLNILFGFFCVALAVFLFAVLPPVNGPTLLVLLLLVIFCIYAAYRVKHL